MIVHESWSFCEQCKRLHQLREVLTLPAASADHFTPFSEQFLLFRTPSIWRQLHNLIDYVRTFWAPFFFGGSFWLVHWRLLQRIVLVTDSSLKSCTLSMDSVYFAPWTSSSLVSKRDWNFEHAQPNSNPSSKFPLDTFLVFPLVFAFH